MASSYGRSGSAKIPLEFYEEVKEGRKDGDKDPLYGWIRDEDTKEKLLLKEEVDVALVQRVINEGYANDLTDDQVEQIGRDPFLIAYALADPKNRCVVTREVSKPGRVRQNRHIPDVCADLGVNCCDPFVFARDLEFSTDWERKK